MAWDPGREHAVSLAFAFHPDYHGGSRLDVENFIKPVIDAIAAGLFCDRQSDLSTIGTWDYDDSNFKTLLIHRLPDTDDPKSEGAAIFISAC